MSRYTSYELDIIDVEWSERVKVIDELKSMYNDADMAIDTYGETIQPVKWYEHQENLKWFSKKYPNNLFLLYLSTEEKDYIKKYFKNGKMQVCNSTITFEDYNEENLK